MYQTIMLVLRKDLTQTSVRLVMIVSMVCLGLSFLDANCQAKPPWWCKCKTQECQSPKTCEAPTIKKRLAIQPMVRSELLNRLRPNRVLIVTTLDRKDKLKEQQTLLNSVANHLRAGSTFDVVEAGNRVCEDCYPLRSGRFDERKLIEFAREYNVDTVLYCDVESIDAFAPMRVQIRYLMVSVDQSVALVSGIRRFDLADPVVETAFLASRGDSIAPGVTHLHSPSRLIDFAAFRLAVDIVSLWR